MVAKLMKHELRSYWKTFLPLWGATLALSVVNGFALRRIDSVNGSLEFFTRVVPMIVFFGLLVAVSVLTLVLVLQRYYRGLLGSEGYLAFTLPVSRRQLLASKLFSSMIVEFLSVAVALLSLVLLGLILTQADFLGGMKEFFAMVNKLFEELPDEGWRMVLGVAELLVLAVVSAAASTLHFYAAMSLGHLSGKYRLPLSVVAYVGLSIVGNYAMVLLGKLGWDSGLMDRLTPVMDVSSGINFMMLLLGVFIVLNLAAAAVLWAISEYILEKKLNLE